MIPQRFIRVIAANIAVIVAFVFVVGMVWVLGSQVEPARAGTLCVKPGGGGGCYATIQGAVDDAIAGDTIQVAEGVYNENVHIEKSLVLEGGWDTDFSGRDWEANVTTIDGGGTGSVIYAEAPIAENITVTIDGFTIIHGDDSAGLGWGGGVRLDAGWGGTSQFTVRHNVIANNYACQAASCQGYGGGIHVYAGSAIIEENTISNNIARWGPGDGEGGGIYVGGWADVTITNNIIQANTAAFAPDEILFERGTGGGINIEYSMSAIVTDNYIQGNFAAVNGPGYGGGIHAKGDLIGNTISGNSASVNDVGYGGGVYAYHVGTFENNTVQENIASEHADGSGGGIYVQYMHDAHFNTIQGNTATRGGGVYYGTYIGNQVFEYNQILDNEATGTDIEAPTFDGGGGIASAAAWVEMTHNDITGNSAYSGAGLLLTDGDQYRIQDNLLEDNTSLFVGGGIAIVDSTGVISANHVISNSAYVGGGLYLWGTADPTLDANVVMSNTAKGFFAAGGGGMLVNVDAGTKVIIANHVIARNAAYGTGYTGGLYCWSGDCTLLHNTIVDNDLGDHDEGVVFGSTADAGDYELRNNIIVGHSTGAWRAYGTLTEDHNAYYDNTTDVSGFAMGAHSLTDDPLFVDRDADYHLDLGSPVIDQGDSGVAVARDFEGDQRPRGSAPDMGADEAYRFETYVSTITGDDLSGDGSPEDPFATVTKGLKETRVGGTVFVGQGLYTERITIEQSVDLYGGFRETDWARDIDAYQTTLDAEGSGTVVLIRGDDLRAVVEGFTITGGEASIYDNGGGIFALGNVAVILRYNTITGNHAGNGGGGVALWSESFEPSLIEANRIDGNSADGVFPFPLLSAPLGAESVTQGPEPGGGVLLIARYAMVVNNFITRNTSDYAGGGLAVSGGQHSIIHNTIADNGEQGLWMLHLSEDTWVANNFIVGHSIAITGTELALDIWDSNGFADNDENYAPGLSPGAHDVIGGASFLDRAGGDYHIRLASGVAGVGIDLGLATDFDGETRPAPSGSLPDLGADEIPYWLNALLPLIFR
ncbi:MAG: right-handed parallel beta-helix repeat-containing protein [Anaerolineales bacterium]|nr:right-handed parallel beta-helix repeat-containing protein [Anaerolineales bacterium]